MEIPDKMIDAQAENMVQDMARRMQSQGLSLDMYLKYTGMTVEQMKEQARPDAEKRIRTRLVLEAVAKAENIQISDEKVDEEVAKMAEAYKMEVEKLKSYMSESDVKQMKEDLAVQQAVDLLVAEAKRLLLKLYTRDRGIALLRVSLVLYIKAYIWEKFPAYGGWKTRI